ncbi:hypothetical protein N656DRAFT_562782 [Canariomyces notabilis]|uniref:Uncharacterized protein n=1 Tax=Canariomyces notabilis TaxID=2074819 RepID=A0AAN6QDZ2_9PEZI|nr:hypothetical protein N656DRAFT_562782 [Canariomyces arenarius]
MWPDYLLRWRRKMPGGSEVIFLICHTLAGLMWRRRYRDLARRVSGGVRGEGPSPLCRLPKPRSSLPPLSTGNPHRCGTGWVDEYHSIITG